ncbi:MAG: ATP-binding cassette domain-containing protein [Candidatus Micrarchaeota archaeon]|nr:ATP-binding cassette domain-containing protein [Candidatus Micrarchaeota archaeon]
MVEHAIEIEGLVKRFGTFTAVNDITFKIKKGEIFGLLGPNGAGKTTTINMILGLVKSTSGRIMVNGLDIKKEGERIKQLIGLMTQETVVEGDLTARENLEIFAELYHVSPLEERNKRIVEALKESELTDFANKKAGTFSGGMKRRLELVKSMIQHPSILILDEPTTGLDIQNRVNMWKHIRELNALGVTIILTTQYLEEADTLCDRIAIIDHGKIKAIGTVSELKKVVGTGRILEIVAENHSDASAVANLLRTAFRLRPEMKVDKVTALVGAGNEEKIMTKLLAALNRKRIKISSVSMHMPTLDDVFMTLTGSSTRDTTHEDTSSRMDAMMRGGVGGRR